MTTESNTATPDASADQALKAKHRAMWAMGDYGAVATEVIAQTGEVLVETSDIRAGQRVLDVAAGSGNASLPAARRGAHVTATDLTPSCSRSAAAPPKPRA